MNKLQQLNQISCQLKRNSQFQQALDMLNQALILLNSNPSLPRTPTYLNLTSLLSQMGMHDKALKYAQISIKYSQEEKPLNNRYIAIAYHNFATVFEQINNYEQALTYHKICFNHCVRTLGLDDPLTQKFQINLNEIRQYSLRKLNQSTSLKRQIRTRSISNKPERQNSAQINRSFRIDSSRSKDSKEATDFSFQQTKKISYQQNFMIDSKLDRFDTQKLPEKQLKKLLKPNENQLKILLNPKPMSKLRQKSDYRYEELKSFLQSDKQSKQSLQKESVKKEEKNEIQQVQKIELSKEFDWTDSDNEKSFLGLKTDRSQEMSPQLQKNRTQMIEDYQNIANNKSDQDRRLEFLLKMEKQNQNSEEVIKNIQSGQSQVKESREMQKSKSLKQGQEKQQSQTINLKTNSDDIVSQMVTSQDQLSQGHLVKYVKPIPIRSVQMIQNQFRKYLKQKKYDETQGFKQNENVILKTIIQPKNYSETKPQYLNLIIIGDDEFFQVKLIDKVKKEKMMKDVDFKYFFDQIMNFDEFMNLKHQQDFDIKKIQQIQYLTNRSQMEKQIVQSEVFKLIVQHIPSLIYIEENQIQLFGVTDWEYKSNEEINNSFVCNQVALDKLLEGKYQEIVKIQSHFRRQGAQKELLMRKKQQQRSKQNQFNIKLDVNDYLTIRTLYNNNPRQILIQVLSVEKKKVSNKLVLPKIIIKKFGLPSKNNIFDIIDYDFNDCSIQFSEYCQYIIQRNKEQKLKRGQKEMQAAYCKIVKAYKIYKLRQQLFLRVEKRKKDGTNNNEESQKIFLIGQKLMKQEVNGYQRSFYLIARLHEIFHQQKQSMKDSKRKSLLSIFRKDIKEEEQEQIITISAYTIDRDQKRFTKIIPFKQKCYETMNQQELASLIRSMLNTCHLFQNKQKHLQLYSKTVEEIQGDIINQWVLQTGVGKFQKEKTLDLRIKLSRENNRVKYFMTNQNICQFTDVCQYMDIDYVPNSIEAIKKQHYDRSFKGIQKTFRQFQYKNMRNVNKMKRVTSWDNNSISSYIENIYPCSEYCEVKEVADDRINTVVIESPTKSSESPLKNRLKNQLEIVKDCIEISRDEQSDIIIHIFLSIEREELTICWRKFRDKEYQYFFINVYSVILQNEQIDVEFIKRYRQQLILNHLNHNDKLLYFRPLDEYNLQELYEGLKKVENLRVLQEEEEQQDDHYFAELVLNKEPIPLLQKVDHLQPFVLLEYHYQYVILTWIMLLKAHDIIIEMKSTLNDEQILLRIGIKQFECFYLEQLAFKKDQQKITSLFSKPLHYFCEQRKIKLRDGKIQSEINIYNISQCLKEYHCIKLQQSIRSNSFYKKFQLLTKCAVSVYLLKTTIEFQNSEYYRITYKYIPDQKYIQIALKTLNKPFKKKLYKLDLISAKTFFGKYYRNRDKILVYFSEQMYYDLTNLPTHKIPNFYKRKFSQFLNIIQDKLIITPDFNLEFLNLGIPIKPQKQPANYKKTIYKAKSIISFLQKVIYLQCQFRLKQKKQWFEICQQRKQELELKNKYKGSLKKRTFMQLKQFTDTTSNTLYIANLYSQEVNSKEQVYVEYIPYKTKPYIDSCIKGIVQVDKSKMLINGVDNFYSQLLKSIKLKNGILELTQQEQQFEPLIIYDQESSSISSKSIFESEPKLVFNYENQSQVYNVFYSGVKPINQKINNDFYQIGINLKQIKNLYPHLDYHNQEIMKHISEQFVDGFNYNEGQILVNRSSIKPSLCSFMKQPEENQFEYSQSRVPKKKKERKTIILKDTKFFNQKRYLIVISYYEKEVNRIIKKKNDQIFQELETNYQILSKQLNSNTKEEIEWLVTPEEAKNLSKQLEPIKIAQYLMERIYCIGERYLFVIDSKSDLNFIHPQENVVVIYKGAINPIGKLVRRRKILMNRLHYLDEMKQWKDENNSYLPNLYVKKIQSLKTNQYRFIVIGGDEKNKKLLIVAWNIENFVRYQVEIPRKTYWQILLDNKKKQIFFELLVDSYLRFNELDKQLQLDIPKDVQNQVDDIKDQQEQLEQLESLDSMKQKKN